MYNFLIYLIVLAIVIWSMEGVNINGIFKKNRVYQAKVFYIILVFSLTYLTSSFIISFLTSLK
jgi:uncharacterized membrane protein YwzB